MVCTYCTTTENRQPLFATKVSGGAYARAKLANALWVRELGRRYPGAVALAVHPGMVYTAMATQQLPDVGLTVTVTVGALVAEIWCAPVPYRQLPYRYVQGV